jgi:alkylated DNA repair dioxygenase AlkB
LTEVNAQAPDSHRNLTSRDADEIIAFDGLVLRFDERFLTPSEADAAFVALIDEVPWTQHSIRLFGRLQPSPRLSSWHGDADAAYRYSGVRHAPQAWTPTLKALRMQLEIALGERFNSVLCNRYRHGQDSMGWHADDEPELGPQPVIASVNLGATRRFDFKRRDRSSQRYSIELRHGALLVMMGDTQALWLHQIAKTRAPVSERINLTYRWVNPVLKR